MCGSGSFISATTRCLKQDSHRKTHPCEGRNKKLHPCPLCEVRTKVVKRHCIKFHFPKCLDASNIEEDVLLLIHIAILDFFCKELNVADIHALSVLVNEKGIHTLQEHSIDVKTNCIAEKLANESVGVPCNILAELLHWRTICNLLSQLSPDRRFLFRELDHVSGSDDSVIQAADAHFHPDILVRDFGVSCLAEIDSKIKCTTKFCHLIGNLCFPTYWDKGFSIIDERLSYSVGYHPRLAIDFQLHHYSQLDTFLKKERVVGFGEVGLDYTNPESSWGAQRVVLRTVVPLAVAHNKVLVIHCRERNPGEDKAGKDCRVILQKILPRYHPIHLHCFVGGILEAREWVRIFPNCRFGISPKFRSGCMTTETVMEFKDRLVLESDAPYLGVKRGEIGHHGLVVKVAREIGKVLGLSDKQVLLKTSENTRRLYKLQ